jgi:RNA polymerase sigma factor (sigma-70 family)
VQSQGTQTRQLQELLDRLRAGDESARDALIEHACERLRRLTRRLKQDFPGIRRVHQTDDVFQEAVMRLYRSLQDVQPENVRAFMGLAATQIRRQLIDVARKFSGPEGIGANQDTNAGRDGQSSGGVPRYEKAQDTAGPATLLLWTEFHQHVGQLPDEEREIFDLIFYQELSQADAAQMVGVSERTIKRRWRSAKLLLHDVMDGELPGM